jgi:hypothetical protein
MGDDLFKSSLPIVLMKDNPGHTIGRDLYGYCLLATIFSYPHALDIVFENFWWWKNVKLN